MSKTECSASLCPCMEPCPLKHAMDILGGKWKIPILTVLRQDGPTRYNDLLRRIKGITNTMLASSLKELERDGLVLRIQYHEMPLRVEYSLTDICEELAPAFYIIGKWGRKILLNQH